ncbi:hypothetical protein M422DRAFT_64398 [Sphaerobolus stellatus SS14]|nr:hypothetical protein M422DRAFT_64398 [Sphaerobolus stellatus SS14]
MKHTFQCSCGTRFTSQRAAKKHQKDKMRVFTCDCGERFPRSENLDNHRSVCRREAGALGAEAPEGTGAAKGGPQGNYLHMEFEGMRF